MKGLKLRKTSVYVYVPREEKKLIKTIAKVN